MNQPYSPGLENLGGNWLNLHRNENLFIDNEWLLEIGKDALSSLNLTQYPDSSCIQLRKKLGEFYGIDPDQIYIGNGSDEILSSLLHYLRAQFSEAVTPAVTYRIYPLLLQRYGYKNLILNKASQNNLCLIDSPNSLTGEVANVFEIPSSFLIWDNVYGEFANDQLNLKKVNKSTVIIRSFSKFYGLANLRIGYCFAHPEIVRALMKRKDIFNVNGFAQKMALHAIDKHQVFNDLIPIVSQARNKLQEGLKALGFILSNSQTNSVWVTHPSVSAEIIQKHLEKSFIAVRRFSESNLSNSLRITIPPLEKVTYLLEVLQKCV